MTKKLNVAMIGYNFMGKATPMRGVRWAGFLMCRLEPVLKVVCGRRRGKGEKGCR